MVAMFFRWIHKKWGISLEDLTYTICKNTIYPSKLKLLAIFVTILVCKQHTLFQTDSAHAQFIIQRWSYLSDFFSQTWTDVSKNSSKTAKNTEVVFTKYFGGNVLASNLCLGYSSSAGQAHELFMTHWPRLLKTKICMFQDKLDIVTL
jgi:hypothetical protein